MATPNAPDHIVVEFLKQATSEPILLRDLGSDFLTINNIDRSKWNNPFKVAVDKQLSKAGNAFYNYKQNGVPLPDGMNVLFRVEGVVIPLGGIKPSKTKGYPSRSGKAEIVIGGIVYQVLAYISQGKYPYYVKVHASKKPDHSHLKNAQQMPKGGKLI